MAIRFATRWAAGQMGGTHVFADLRPGDVFHFPKHPEVLYRKRHGGWFRPTDPVTRIDFDRCFRTGAGTAVVKV